MRWGLLSELKENFLRICARKGFGLQSPFAFYFENEIINQKLPYYAYKKLARQRWRMSGLENSKRMDELFFRITNYIQPKQIILPKHGWEMSAEYVSAACSSASLYRYTSIKDVPNLLNGGNRLVFLRNMDDFQSIKDICLTQLSSTSLLVIKDIRTSPDFWRSLINDNRVGVTFDLYNLGLVFFDKSKTKGNYKINKFR